MNGQGQDQGAPPALVVGEDGLHDYPTLQHPTADSLTTLGGDTSQGLQLGGPLGFDELMKSVEFGAGTTSGSFEFAGSLAGKEFNFDRFPYGFPTQPTPSTSQSHTSCSNEQSNVSSATSPENYHSCASSPRSSLAPSNKLFFVVLGIPTDGTRTRVETQIKITFALLQPKSRDLDQLLPEDLLNAEGELSSAALERCDLVTRFSHIKLPTFAAIKRKHKKHQRTDIPSDQCLLMDTRVIKSDSDEQVFICTNCQERERKRAQRKKNPKVKPEPEIEEDSEVSPDDPRRIILFNSGQHLEFGSGQATIPARIACYCRHHKEKTGFRLHCVLRNGAEEIVCQTKSRTIFTTDDHKARPRNSNASAATSVSGGAPLSRNVTSENLEALAREHHQQKFVHPDQPQVSNECGPGPRTGGAVEAPSLGKSMPIKKHSARVDKPYDSAQRAKRPVSKRSNSFSRSRHFSMTPLDTPIPSPSMSGNTSPAMTPLPGQTPAPSCSDAFISLPTSPIFPSEPGFVNLQDLTFNPPPAGPSPRSNDQSESGTSPGPSADSASVNSSHTSQDVHDMSVDASPSCAPSQLDESRWTSPTESRFPAPEVVPAFNSNSESALPAVNRLVPNEGPISGGIEVTVLGQNFRSDMTLLFGDTPAVSTHLWSSNTMVCILPPGASPGPVMVAIKDHPVDLSNGVQLFTYVDSSDRALMELALQVVGLKMTGKLEGARDVAMRIIGNTGSTDDRASTQSAFDPSEFITSASGSQHMPFSSDFEGTIMRFLVMLDHPLADHTPADLPTTQSVLSLKNDQQQGLLHLAAILGFHRLTSFCLSHGADPDIKDRYEMTPLHFAALHGRVTITRVLLQAGASTFIRSRFGRTAYDMAVERDQPDVVSLFPTRIHRRKLSGRAIEDINSRRSSRSSLFSFYTQNEDDSEIDFTPADDDSNASADVSSEEDGEDLEARLSRTPSTVSLSSPGEPGSPTVLKAPLPEEKSSAHVKVGDVAAAYSGWIAKLNEKLPQAALLRPTYTFKSPFTYSPNWAEKLPQFPTNTPQLVRVDHVKAWWHSKSNSAPTAAEPGADRPSLSTFNPPAGHFWRPFDVIRRASFSTTQPPATPPTPTHTYPPPQLSEMQPSEAIRHRLARRLGYVPQDINDNVLKAIDYHRSKYTALRRRRVFFVFVLPVLLLALAWMFYGSNNGFILEALLYRSASFVSTIASAASKPILTAT